MSSPLISYAAPSSCLSLLLWHTLYVILARILTNNHSTQDSFLFHSFSSAFLS